MPIHIQTRCVHFELSAFSANYNLIPGASHFLWLCGCGATSSPFKEVWPTHVCEAASDGEQGVGAHFRPAASRLIESVADDVLAGTFHDVGSDRQSVRPIEVATHSVRGGLAIADAGRDGFGPAAARLQNSDHLSDLPGLQLLPNPVHAEPTHPDCNPPKLNSRETRKRKTGSNQRNWDAPCVQRLACRIALQ